MLYDIARTNANSPWDQYFAEMWWWTKFVICTPLWIGVEPLSLDLLQNQHTEMRVQNFWVHNDSSAAQRFIETAHDWKHDGEVLVLRNMWANNTDNKLRFLNSTDNFRKYLEMDRNYSALIIPKNKHWHFQDMPFTDMLDQIEDTSEALTTLTFSYEFTSEESQPWLWKHYSNLWENLGLNFNDANGGSKIMGQSLYRTHSFLYYGDKGRTRLHSAPPSDYFLQVAGKKRWRLIHKRYIPYVGLYRQNNIGVMRTPEYWAADYPGEKIPYVDVVLEPGDMLFFSYWQVHEVWNISPDKLGLAIGIRPMDNTKRLWKEPCRALLTYNFLLTPFFLQHGMTKHRTTLSTGSQVEQRDRACTSQGGVPYTYGYNGTKLTRYDLKKINGSCLYKEKIPNYQDLEVRKTINPRAWHPYEA